MLSHHHCVRIRSLMTRQLTQIPFAIAVLDKVSTAPSNPFAALTPNSTVLYVKLLFYVENLIH